MKIFNQKKKVLNLNLMKVLILANSCVGLYKFRKELVNKPVYFAYCFPYTYTNLQNYLNSLSLDPANKSLIKFSTLGNTVCGNPLDILYITNWNDTNLEQKKIIFFKC